MLKALALEQTSVKLTNNRYYLDYNASAPLSKSVLDWLPKGAISFGNPNSIHSEGKLAAKLINQTSNELFDIFGLQQSEFQVFYHSGATEGINTILKGFLLNQLKHNSKATLLYMSTDHSAVRSIAPFYHQFDCVAESIKVDQNGALDLIDLEKKILSHQNIILNITVSNNETGVVHDYQFLQSLKEKYKIKIHVDCAQVVAKIYDWNKLSPMIDSYTFSGHKFGAFKGVGFTFVRKDFEYLALVHGGGQQNGQRAGTQNVHAIFSLSLALKDALQYDLNTLKTAKDTIETGLKALGSEHCQIVACDGNRNLNTILFLLPKQKIDLFLIKADMQGLALSSGSACSSGVISESHVLREMGYSSELSRSGVRLSLGPSMSIKDVEIINSYIIKLM